MEKSLESLFHPRESETRYHPNRFIDNLPGHLGSTFSPIHKDNGDFIYAISEMKGSKGSLNLEGIAFRPDAGNVQVGKDFAPPTFEATGQIPDRYPGDDFGVDIGAPAEDQSTQGPIDYIHSFEVSATDDKIGIVQSTPEYGDDIGIMRQISVHLDNCLIAVFQRPFETRAVCRSQA
jgi:hypothetical protein